MRSNGIIDKCKSLFPYSCTGWGTAVWDLMSDNKLTGVPPMYSKTGITFNGVNQYSNTHINPSVIGSPYSTTIFERNNNSTTLGIDWGCAVSGDNTKSLYGYVNTTSVRFSSYSALTANTLTGTTTTGIGNYFWNDTTSNKRTIRKNKTQVTSSSVALVGLQPNFDIYIGAENTSGTATNFANRNIQMWGYFSPALTVAQQNTFSDAVDLYYSTRLAAKSVNKDTSVTNISSWHGQSNCIGAALNTTLDTSLNYAQTRSSFFNGSSFSSLSPTNCQYPPLSNIASGAILEFSKDFTQSGDTLYDVMYSVSGKPLYDAGTLTEFYPLRKGTYCDLGISNMNNALDYFWNTLHRRGHYNFYFVFQGGETDAGNNAGSLAYKTNIINFATVNKNNVSGTALDSSAFHLIIPEIILSQNLNITNTGIIQAKCDSVATVGVAGFSKVSKTKINTCATPPHYNAAQYKELGDSLNVNK